MNRPIKTKWKIGDIFVVQTSDRKYVIGQVVGQERCVLNSVSVAFFDCRIDAINAAAVAFPICESNVFAVLFTTRDLLDSGQWQVVGNRSVSIPESLRPYEVLRKTNFVGAKVVGSRNVNDFLNAFYALCPWDDWKDPHYLDALLISPSKKPANLVYKRQ